MHDVALKNVSCGLDVYDVRALMLVHCSVRCLLLELFMLISSKPPLLTKIGKFETLKTN